MKQLTKLHLISNPAAAGPSTFVSKLPKLGLSYYSRKGFIEKILLYKP